MSPGITASRPRERAPLKHHAARRNLCLNGDNIGCEEALKRLAEFIDCELSDSEQDNVEQHLRTCRSCYSRMEFESRLKQRLSALSGDDAPAKSRDRIRKLIKGF